MTQDVRYSLRMLRKQPLSNGIIVLSIALLIGAVSVLYTAETDTRAGWAPYPDRDRIVSLWRVGEHKTIALFSSDLFHGFRDGITSFEALGALRGSGQVTLTGMGDPMSYRSLSVTKDVFDITRPKPVQGRLFAEEDYAQASDRLVLISEQLWREKLDADTNIIGGELLLDDKTCSVIGVMPAAMRTTLLAHGPDVWRPMRVDWGDPIGHLRLIAKLKPGATRRNAQAELDVLAPRLESQRTVSDWEKRWGSEGFKTARAVPATRPRWIADNETPPEVIFGYVFAGLLVACIVGITAFNITNLLLARFSARAREVSIRLALGASRLAMVRQLLTETLLLALLGGMVGLLASFWFSDLLRFHRIDPKMDWRLYLLAFSGAATLGMFVVERTREVGIRMAVGATRWQILRLMMWQGIRLMLLRDQLLRARVCTNDCGKTTGLFRSIPCI
jgi:putative ABC transport system permease protein